MYKKWKVTMQHLLLRILLVWLAYPLILLCSCYYIYHSPIAAIYTYYKTFAQEAVLKRNGKYEERKITRRQRERVVRVSKLFITI